MGLKMAFIERGTMSHFNVVVPLQVSFFLLLEATQKTKEYFSHNWKKIVYIAQLVSLYCIIEH
jgi:hypothetical protein